MKAKYIVAIALAGSIAALLANSCKDMGEQPQPPRLTATLLAVTLSPGAQTSVTIRGGTPPYVISRQPDTLIARATLVGSELTLRAAPANIDRATVVRIKDTDQHSGYDALTHEEQEIEIAIHVSANVVSYTSQVQPILTTNCVNAGCHPGGGAPFSLQAAVSYNNLVGVNATNAPCAGDKRVFAGNASASALVKRLEGSCGLRMPLGLSPLSADQIRIIRDWIDQGALNN